MKPIAGRYHVVGVLGQGGAGEVLDVRDERTGERLALKRPSSSRRTAPVRLQREYHVLAGIRHPHVVAARGFGIDEDGTPFYTMERLAPLDLETEVTLAPEQVARLLAEIGSALAFLHARRLVHRDVSPKNICRADDGRFVLTDFGTLVTMGPPRDVAGTPPCVAPEAARKLPLDGRADLFSLGCTAYYLLTGRFPYEARSFDDLEASWRRQPPPPSALRGGLPPTLDELVRSLVHLDPLARPSSAHEVLDRVAPLATLPQRIDREPEVLGHPAFVGRGRPRAMARERLRAALEGRGGALLVEGPAGIGVSRMLAELGVDAVVAGATVLSVGCGGRVPGAWTLHEALVREALREAHRDVVAARDALPSEGRRDPWPDLDGNASGRSDPAPSPHAADRSHRRQAAVRWWLALAVRRPLVLVVDDVDEADEGSLDVLAELAHAARDHAMLVIAGRHGDRVARAPRPLQALERASTRLPLEPLSTRQVARMLESLFGAVPNVAPLAERLVATVGGNPLACVEMARHLVESGAVRRVDGSWELPPSASWVELPRALGEMLDRRLAGLSASARALAEILAVHAEEAPLELLAAVVEPNATDAADDRSPEHGLFAALDELVARDLVEEAGGVVRLRLGAMRDRVVARLHPDRRRRLHLRIGRAMLRVLPPSAAREAVAGAHLVRGGDDVEGARRSIAAGRWLVAHEAFADAIEPLELGLEALERCRGSPAERLRVRHELVMCGAMSDRATLLRHAEPAVEALARAAGLRTASWLGRWIGRPLALATGLLLASLRWLLTPTSRRRLGPFSALARFLTCVPYATTAVALGFDLPALATYVRRMQPLAIGRRSAMHACVLVTRAIAAVPAGALGTVRALCRDARRNLETDRLTPLRAIDRTNGIGATLFMEAGACILDLDPAAEPLLERLERLGPRFFAASVLMARAMEHRLRGEEPDAVELEARAENALRGLGSTWIVESQRHWISMLAYGLTRDLSGLRRSTEALVRACEQGFRFEALVALGRGEYLRERGEYDAARRSLEQALRSAPAGGFVAQAARCALAETLLAAQRLDEATDVARDALEIASRPDTGRVAWRARATRALALVESARGQHAAAAARLEQAIAVAQPSGWPVMLGSLHEARALVALEGGDRDAFELHRAATARWFLPTRNPALVARAERLRAAGVQLAPALPMGGGFRAEEAVTQRSPAARSHLVCAVLDGARSAEERAEGVLELLCRETGAQRGHLYYVAGGTLRHVAPARTLDPRSVAEVARKAYEAATREQVATLDAQPDDRSIVLLRARPSDSPLAVAVLEGDGGPLRPVDPLLAHALVRRLCDTGDLLGGLRADAPHSTPS